MASLDPRCDDQATGQGEPTAGCLLVCGGSRVYEVDLGASSAPRWAWSAVGAPELPPRAIGLFRATAECKPAYGGSRVLVASSAGGVAIVERPSGRVLFWTVLEDAHSLCLWYDGLLVVAAGSYERVSEPPTGSLVGIDLSQPERPAWTLPFPGAHGVTVAEDGSLWALGDQELREYRRGGSPSDIRLGGAWPLPGRGGHDLSRTETGAFSVTVADDVWTFCPESGRFYPHPALAGIPMVKCVDQRGPGGRVAWTRGRGRREWFDDRVRLLMPEGEHLLPGERVYKARWLSEP